MTKHVNMRSPEVVNRSAKNGGSRWAGFVLVAICAFIGWSMAAIAGVEPPQPVKNAVSVIKQQIAYDISKAGDTLYGSLFR